MFSRFEQVFLNFFVLICNSNVVRNVKFSKDDSSFRDSLKIRYSQFNI